MKIGPIRFSKDKRGSHTYLTCGDDSAAGGVCTRIQQVGMDVSPGIASGGDSVAAQTDGNGGITSNGLERRMAFRQVPSGAEPRQMEWLAIEPTPVGAVGEDVCGGRGSRC